MTTYRSWNTPEYKGNPLIEALPECLNLKKFMIKVLSKPNFTEDERTHNDIEREFYSERLDSCIIPNSEYYRTYKKIYKLFVKAYINRNPLNPSSTQIKYSVASNGKIPHPNKSKKTTADSIFITGLSGMGKSYMVENILESVFYQNIPHQEYNGTSLNFEQLLYIKFNCPGDASKRALLLNFFKAVDKATKKTNYETENSGNNLKIYDLENNLKKVCLNHHIGAIIIDELQNLSIAKSGGAKSAMQFFESIASEAFVSLIFIGTYDCFDIYDGNFSVARRMSKDGVVDLIQPEITDPSWLKLVEKLWDVQWVQNPTKVFKSKDGNNDNFDESVAKGIIDAIYFCTQGITVCTTTLLKHANVYAIEQGLETITADILYQVYKKEFKLLHPALQALEDQDYKAYNELMPLAERIKKMRKQPESSSFSNNKAHSKQPVTENEQASIIIAPNKLQWKKRQKESAQDCFNRLKPNGFFCRSFAEVLN